MFDQSVVDMSNEWFDISVGEISELLVFYDRVHIRTPSGRLFGLFRQLIAADDNLSSLAFFTSLVAANKVRLAIDDYPPGEIALQANLLLPEFSSNDIEQGKTLQVFGLALETGTARADSKSRLLQDLESALYTIIEGRRGDAMKLIETIVRKTRLDAYDGYPESRLRRIIDTVNLFNHEEGLSEDFTDFLRTYFCKVQHYSEPEFNAILNRLSIKIVDVHGYQCKAIAFSSIGVGQLMPAINMLQHSFNIASKGSTKDDHYTSPATRVMLTEQYTRAISHSLNIDNCKLFQESIVPGQRIAEQINRGAKTFADMEPIIASREPFADVIRNKPYDKSLAEWYFEEISRSPYTRTFKQRSLRWGAITAPGIIIDLLGGAGIGTALGTAASAIDSILLGSLKANQGARLFVNNQLKPFIRS